MMRYQAVPYQLYPAGDSEFVHFDEDSLALTSLPDLHCNVLSEFDEKRTKEEVIAIHKGNPNVAGIIDELIELGLIKEMLPPTPQQEFCLQPRIRAFRIVLTEKCNLQCAECFVTKHVDTLRTMSEETLERIIRETIPYGATEQVTYHFFGGEPLLCFDYIKRAVAILEDAVARGYIVRPLYTITTNATILTDEIIEFFREHDFKVGVSVDGPQDLNDQLRIHPDGSGTFNIIKRNYQRFVEAGIDCHVLVTPHLDHLDALPDAFRNILESFPMKTVTVNTPLHFDTLQWIVPGDQYAKLLIQLLRIAKEFDISVDSAASPPLAALANNVQREGPCALICNTVMTSIGPDGSTSYCSQKWHPFLTMPDSTDAKIEIPICRATDCLTCEARGICGGPCPAYQRISNNYLDKNKCNFMRTLLWETIINLDLFEELE